MLHGSRKCRIYFFHSFYFGMFDPCLIRCLSFIFFDFGLDNFFIMYIFHQLTRFIICICFAFIIFYINLADWLCSLSQFLGCLDLLKCFESLLQTCHILLGLIHG